MFVETDASWRALTITVLLSLVGGATWGAYKGTDVHCVVGPTSPLRRDFFVSNLKYTALSSFFFPFSAPFASTPKVSGNALNYSDVDITWQENANNIAQVAATPFAAYILTRHDGLRGSVFLSAATLLLQCGLFAVVVAVPSLPSAVPLAASIAGGVNCAFVQGVPTMISAMFFPPARRGRTTAIMYTSTYIGVCTSYLGYAYVERAASFKGLQNLLYCEAGLAFLLLLATAYFFPAPQDCRVASLLQRVGTDAADAADAADVDADADLDHAREPSGAVGGNRRSSEGGATPSRLGFAQGLLHCLRQPSVVLLIVAAAATNGTLTAWQGVIPILFRDLGNATTNGSAINGTGGGGGNRNGFKSSRGDICSLISSLGYAMGGYFGGELGDRCFANKLKTLLVTCISLGAVTFLFIVLLIPPTFFPSWLQIHVDSGPNGVYSLLLSFSFMSGACLGGTMPVALEILAETAYPAAEGITANASLFLTQLFCFALTALVPVWSAQLVTFAVLATAGSCLVLTLIADASNNRRKAQLKAAAHDAYLN